VANNAGQTRVDPPGKGQDMRDDRVVLTNEEAAALLRCSVRQVQYLIANEGLPVVYLGTRQRRIPRSALEQWVAERTYYES
jgi:excisionase family DNA binding protein